MPNKMKQDASIKDLKASLKEYNGLVSKLTAIGEVKKEPLQFDTANFSIMGREEKRVYLWDKIKTAYGTEAYENINKLIKLTHQSYNQFKALPSSQLSTHRYITEQAVKLLDLDSAIAKTLLEYCTYPDEPKSDMSDLIFEGHFYGKTNSGAPGNFLVNLFPQVLLALEAVKKLLHGKDEDIHEHAVMNFARHYDSHLHAGSVYQKYFYLGVAAHYLQDLTAPHHAGNYPAVPYVDHYFFEKFASQYVYGKPKFKISQNGYNEFASKINSSLNQPQSFAREISGMAAPYIKFVETEFHHKLAGNANDASFMDAQIDSFNKRLISGKNQEWAKAIDGAVPLAVYATTYLFETALE
jgi:hypothetical protein